MDIKAKILEFAQEGVTRYEIFHKLRMPYTQIYRYLQFLKDIQLVEIEEAGGRQIYITTEKGRKWLSLYQQLKELEK